MLGSQINGGNNALMKIASNKLNPGHCELSAWEEKHGVLKILAVNTFQMINNLCNASWQMSAYTNRGVNAIFVVLYFRYVFAHWFPYLHFYSQAPNCDERLLGVSSKIEYSLHLYHEIIDYLKSLVNPLMNEFPLALERMGSAWTSFKSYLIMIWHLRGFASDLPL